MDHGLLVLVVGRCLFLLEKKEEKEQRREQQKKLQKEN